MKTNRIKSFFKKTPSWILAVLTLIVATLVLFGVGELCKGLSSRPLKINNNIAKVIPYIIGNPTPYIIYDLLIAVCCYFIIRWNPKSVWYIALICNVYGIIAAIMEPAFWHQSLWILIFGGWVVSLIASIIGMQDGKRVANRNANTLQSRV